MLGSFSVPWLVAESAEPSAKAATPETEKSNKERIAALCIIMFEIESVDLITPKRISRWPGIKSANHHSTCLIGAVKPIELNRSAGFDLQVAFWSLLCGTALMAPL